MKTVDFLIVGAGVAGLSSGARLARHGSVIVCEAEEAPGMHASGRSAAFAHFDMADPVVCALTAASIPMFEEPAARMHPALFVALEGQEKTLERLARNYRHWVPGVRSLDPKDAVQIMPALRPEAIRGALFHDEGRKLDAHAMLEGHRKALHEAGGLVLTKAPVTAMCHHGGFWTVDTPQGSYRAKIVVNAAGAWVDRVARLASVGPIGIRPLRRTVITFDAPEGRDVAAWPFTKTVGPGVYIEPEGQGRLLACPMDEHPSDPCDAYPEEEDVALAAWRVEQTTTLTVRRIAAKWAGLRSFAPDNRPVAGFDAQAPNFFWLAGQGGFGLQTSPAMALAVEALATHADWPEELRAVGVGPSDLSAARFG